MHKELNHLIETLREELQQYREMLVRLDRQNQVGMARSGNDSNSLAGEIKAQCQAIHHAQYLRIQAGQDVADTLHLKVMNPMEEVIPLLPMDYQSLIGKLYRENREQMEQVVFSLLPRMSCTKN